MRKMGFNIWDDFRTYTLQMVYILHFSYSTCPAAPGERKGLKIETESEALESLSVKAVQIVLPIV
jgi:hypothetical protein